jgi:hypothetical protein
MGLNLENMTLINYLKKRDRNDRELIQKMSEIVERLDTLISISERQLSKTGGTSHAGRT